MIRRGNTLRLLLAGAGLVLASPILSAQGLTAREIFYAPAPAKAAKTTRRSSAATAKKTEPAAPTAPQTEVARQPAPQTAVPAPPPGPVTRVTLAAMTRKPLGVRLSILKVARDGEKTEVAPDTMFQPGDRVRLNIQVSDKGYLYIINRGSSGTWTQLFPSPEMPNATNEVVPGVTYSVPPDRNFVVSNPPGSEKLFIILSREPQLDVQALTVDMSRREAAHSSSDTAPKQEPTLPAHKPLETTMAANLPPMNDQMVDRLRQFYARDLIIEKVDEQTPGAKKENAVYAVSTGDGDDTRVVLDAEIKH